MGVLSRIAAASAVAGACLAVFMAPAKAEEQVLAKSDKLGIVISTQDPGSGWCAERVRLQVTAQDPAIFEGDALARVAALLGKRILSKACPKASVARVRGVDSAGVERALATIRADAGWAWSPTPVIREVKARPSPKADPSCTTPEGRVVAGGEQSEDAPLLQPGDSLYRPAEGGQLHFRTRNAGACMTLLKVELERGYVRLSGELKSPASVAGKTAAIPYRTKVSFADNAETMLMNIPQAEGVISWQVGWPEVPVRITVLNGPPLSRVPPVAGLGGVVVEGAPAGRLSLLPADGEIALRQTDGRGRDASVTPLRQVLPDGRELFVAPTGLWQLTLEPERVRDGAPAQESVRNVVVAPGKYTAVTWPSHWRGADAASGELTIRGGRGDSREASVDVAVRGALGAVSEPAPDQFTIAEGPEAGEVIAVERVPEPFYVDLAVDSSGSMKGDMARVKRAVADFIRQLPGHARVRLIDFDTRPRRIDADTRADLLRRLEAEVRANGATALYDTAIASVQALSESERGALVLFTDGKDANFDDTARGSKATRREAYARVADAGVPVFAIGYGDGADGDTLAGFARRSGGAHYTADAASLESVFAQIRSALGGVFRIHYARPEQQSVFGAPVVALAIDNSGSMAQRVGDCPTCGVRIEETRQVIRRFIERMPGEAVIHLTGFTDRTRVLQSATDDRAAIYAALGHMVSDGGTDIETALRNALNSLTSVAAPRRYLVFITDTGLALPEPGSELHGLLQEVKEAEIRPLWVGMVNTDGGHRSMSQILSGSRNDEDPRLPFMKMAEIAGGDVLVADDPEKLGARMDALADRLLQEPADVPKPSIQVEMRLAEGDQSVRAVGTARLDLPVDLARARSASANVARIEVRDLPDRRSALMGMIDGTIAPKVLADVVANDTVGHASPAALRWGLPRVDRTVPEEVWPGLISSGRGVEEALQDGLVAADAAGCVAIDYKGFVAISERVRVWREAFEAAPTCLARAVPADLMELSRLDRNKRYHTLLMMAPLLEAPLSDPDLPSLLADMDGRFARGVVVALVAERGEGETISSDDVLRLMMAMKPDTRARTLRTLLPVASTEGIGLADVVPALEGMRARRAVEFVETLAPVLGPVLHDPASDALIGSMGDRRGRGLRPLARAQADGDPISVDRALTIIAGLKERSRQEALDALAPVMQPALAGPQTEELLSELGRYRLRAIRSLAPHQDEDSIPPERLRTLLTGIEPRHQVRLIGELAPALKPVLSSDDGLAVLKDGGRYTAQMVQVLLEAQGDAAIAPERVSAVASLVPPRDRDEVLGGLSAHLETPLSGADVAPILEGMRDYDARRALGRLAPVVEPEVLTDDRVLAALDPKDAAEIRKRAEDARKQRRAEQLIRRATEWTVALRDAGAASAEEWLRDQAPFATDAARGPLAATHAYAGSGIWDLFFRRARVVTGPMAGEGARSGLYDPIGDVWLIFYWRYAGEDQIEIVETKLATGERIRGRPVSHEFVLPAWFHGFSEGKALLQAFQIAWHSAVDSFGYELGEAPEEDAMAAAEQIAFPALAGASSDPAFRQWARGLRDSIRRGATEKYFASDSIEGFLGSLPSAVRRSLDVLLLLQRDERALMVLGSPIHPSVMMTIEVDLSQRDSRVETIEIGQVDLAIEQENGN